MSAARIVCVLGMHRSGTSAVTGLLVAAGLDPGDRGALAAPGPANPRGYWENLELRAINDAVLEAFGGSWIAPPELPEGWERDARLDALRGRAAAALAEAFNREGIAVWKDPRTSLTVPFWSRLLPAAAYVVCLRNPLSVMASLAARDGLPPFLARDLWSEYVDAALWDTEGLRRVVVHFEDVLADPARAVRRIHDTLGLDVPRAVAGARAPLDPALAHHAHSPAEAAASPALDAGTRRVYQELWSRRGGEVGAQALYADVARGLGGWQASPELLLAARGVERSSGARRRAAAETAHEAVRRWAAASRRELGELLLLEQELATTARAGEGAVERLHAVLAGRDPALRGARAGDGGPGEHLRAVEARLAALEERLSWVEVRLAARLRTLLTPARELLKRLLGRRSPASLRTPRVGRAAGRPARVVALLATYNEERFVGACLDHLIGQGAVVYLIDNESTDRTVEIADGYRGRGLIGFEVIPRRGLVSLRPLLRRKEQLADSLDADWFMHADADEIRLPTRSDRTLAQDLAAVDAEGFNAVNFQEFTFTPTRESPDHDHPDFQRTMRWYYPFLPSFPHRLNAWKRRPGVEIAWSAGHLVRFPGLRMYPASFRMRHYLFLSVAHARLKFVERAADPEEVRDGWHGWRASLRPDQIVLPREAQLRRYVSDDKLDPSRPRARHLLDPG